MLGWLYPFRLDSWKNFVIFLNQISFFVVSLGFGTFSVLLLNLFYGFVAYFEVFVSSILLLFVLLVWVSISFFMRGIFLVFHYSLFLAVFVGTNVYYPYVTLLLFVLTFPFFFTKKWFINPP